MPTCCNPVYVISGTTVTVDINNAVATTITITGQLSFKRSGDNELTQTGGNLFVNGGGTLDMGTQGSPIPQGTTAYLTLSSGTTAGQYGLIVNPGGNFLVYGNTKTPSALLTANANAGATSISIATTGLGWSVGDTLTVDTEAVTINTLSAGSIGFGTGQSLGQTHSSTTAIVGNLTRNVVIRSSGTDVGVSDAGNAAYLENLVTNTTSFNVNYGEFAYLGAASGGAAECGVSFNGGVGSLSSSTVHNGDTGVLLVGNAALSSNLIYANASDGIYFSAGSQDTLVSNSIYANGGNGIEMNPGSNNTFTANNVFSNVQNGIFLNSGSNNTLAANNVYLNNPADSSFNGINIQNSNNNVLIGNSLYFNTDSSAGALFLEGGSTGNLWVGGGLGYTPAGVSAPDTTSEVSFDNTSTNNLVIKTALINPAVGIQTSGFVRAGSYLVNYSTNAGVAQVYGDYKVSGSPFTLDYATNSYASTVLNLKAMQGNEALGDFTVNWTSDTYAVSQLITILYTGSQWQVTGSTTSGILCTFAATGAGPTNCPSASPQFALTLNVADVTPVAGDKADFALIAASSDAYKQKSLQFAATTGSNFNHNRSKIEISTGAWFEAIGISTAPSVITEMTSGGTYYTFVDSGAFTVSYASFTDMDESGVQLSSAGASGPWSISNSTFDYSGSGVGSTSTLITLNGITNSTITLYNVTYSSTSDVTTHKFNYNIIGSSTGLSWTNQAYSGTLTGANNTQDDTTQKHILWEPVGCPTFTSLVSASVLPWSSTSTWDSGIVPTQCNPVVIPVGSTVTVDDSDDTASTITITGRLTFSRVSNSTLTIVGGNAYVNSGGTLDMGSSSLPINASSATLILASGTVAGQYGLIVNPGGNFLVYGAAKTPWSLYTGGSDITSGTSNITVVSASGWQQGDMLTIDTETVTINGTVSGNNVPITHPTLTHSAANTIYISNLSRNVLIESSGTVVSGGGGNSAYIRNLVQNTTNFNVNYGEFAYLGTPASGEYGITFDGTGVTGSISSSTIRNGYNGIYLNKAVNSTFTADLVYAQNSDGVDDISGSGNTYLASRIYANSGNGLNSQSQNNTITGNFVFWNTGTNNLTLSGSGNMISSNTLFGTTIGIWVQGSKHILNSNSVSGSSSYGIYVNATNITLLTNRIFNNTGFGLYLAGANGSTLISNLCYTNGSGGSNFGVEIYGGSNILAVANQIYSNLNGFYTFNTSSMTLVSNRIYSNSNYGLYFGISSGKSFGTVVSEDQLGFNGSGGSSPDSTAEVRFNGNSKDHVVFRHIKINPANAQISTGGGFEYPSNYLVSYNQDNGVGADTGTVRIFGDYVVSGSTFAMDYSSQVYTSTNTLPKLMFGTGHSITSVTTFDGATLSELITVTYQGGNSWQVVGSSSGVLGSLTCAAGSMGCSFSSGKVALTMNAGSTTNIGDFLDFVTLAASNDANLQKKIYFAPAYGSPNYSRSKIETTSGGAFEAIGVSTAPTIMTMLGGSTYYTFVDSGAFNVQYASFTDMDESGLPADRHGAFRDQRLHG